MIQRCNDRIRDGIMPQWWEEKLEQYEKRKKDYENLMGSEPAGLSFEVVIRLKRLETVKSSLLQADDKYNAIPNIDAIMKDYRAGGYVWDYGKVTYWSNGKFLCGPKEFDVDEFLLLHSEHDGPKGFWAEIHDNPGDFSASPAIGHTLPQGNDPA
ncbi:hypothetical protein N7481_010117 [Penicillium waksmanii]|uniref:uncharacterized protein n=1 Tax=Penicillium waksmanii TaxID=69791 RepID=UPI00254798D0|nr:uncharacterized protein N7481_010117 [Penicillium waksmanii]KAJ5976410.1 hypothetical protein N7481_010117 [Penicillium waksmanii]